jgi:hypothetical protein
MAAQSPESARAGIDIGDYHNLVVVAKHISFAAALTGSPDRIV